MAYEDLPHEMFSLGCDDISYAMMVHDGDEADDEDDDDKNFFYKESA